MEQPPPNGKREGSSSPDSPPDISLIDPPLRLNLDDSPSDDIYRLNDTLLPCAVCGRTFAPESLAKHVTICLKTSTKKRKQFDSSNQRRQGTDLAQYLPKNFGLPEHSPFAEREKSKSPPPTHRMSTRSKATNHQPTHTRLLAQAESSPCPHCGRNFGARAIDRHISFCAEQTRLARAPGASSGPENVRVARERLFARTSYRAPLGKSKRSMNREKYSLSRSASEGSGMSDRSFDEMSRDSRGTSVEYKHLPSITKTSTPQSMASSVTSLPRNHKKIADDDSYDPYQAAEKQLRDLMASATNLTKLDLSLDLKRESSPLPNTPKLTQRSPTTRKDESLLNNNMRNSNFQRSTSLRSPTRNNYTPEITRKYNSSLPKPTLSLNAVLNSNKSSQNDGLNKLGRSSLRNANSLNRPKNEPVKNKQPSSRLNDNAQRFAENHRSIKLEPVSKSIRRRDDNHNDYEMSASMNDSILGPDDSFIDPRLINKDQPLPKQIQKYIDNPELLSSQESLIRESLSKKLELVKGFEGAKDSGRYSRENSRTPHSRNSDDGPTTPIIDDLSAQYDKIMISLEQSLHSKKSTRDEDALFNDLEEIMSSIEGETSPGIFKKNSRNSPHNNVKKDSYDGLNYKNKLYPNDTATDNPKQKNIPFNKSISLNFSTNANKSYSNSPTFSKSKSPFDSNANGKLSNQRKPSKSESQLEEDIMQSLKDIDKLCEKSSEKNSDSENGYGGFLNMKDREKYINENNFYTQDADISNFLPKNLGITDESPFLDIEKKSSKNAQDEDSELHKRLLDAMRNLCCQNCGHYFDVQAWCAAEQARLEKSSKKNFSSQPSYEKQMSKSLNYPSRVGSNNFRKPLMNGTTNRQVSPPRQYT